MAFSLKDLLDGNSKQQPQRRAAPPRPASTGNLASKVYDQVNIFDNNRTFKQRKATNNLGTYKQLEQNSLANAPRTVGEGLAAAFSPDVRAAQRSAQNLQNIQAQTTAEQGRRSRDLTLLPQQRQQAQRLANFTTNQAVTSDQQLQKESQLQIDRTDPKRMAAAAVELALTAYTAPIAVGSSKVARKVASEALKKSGKIAGAKALGKGLAKEGAKMIPVTAPFGATQALITNPDATAADIAKSTAIAGAFGVALPTAFAGGSVLAKPVAQATSKLIPKRAPLNESGAIQAAEPKLTPDQKVELLRKQNEAAALNGELSRADTFNNAMVAASEAPKLRRPNDLKGKNGVSEILDLQNLRNKLIAAKSGIKPLGNDGYVMPLPDIAADAVAKINNLARNAKNNADFKKQLGESPDLPQADRFDSEGFFKNVKKEVELEKEITKVNPSLVVKAADSPENKNITLLNAKQQASKAIQDGGEKMFGSKKDLSKLRIIGRENLQYIESQGERVAANLVTKERVLGENAKYVVNTAGDPGLEQLKSTILAAIPKRPAANPTARQLYLELVPKLNDTVRNAGGREELVDKVLNEFRRGVSFEQRMQIKKQLGAKFYNVLAGNSDAIRLAVYRPATDFSWAEKRAVAPRSTTAGAPTLHGGELVPYSRQGATPMTGLTPDEIRDGYKFKGLEYGNYVKDVEAREHLARFGESMHDMGQVMGINMPDLIEQMQLGVGFGSRGGGKALAHYEPSGKVINITKKSGADGTLGHEFGHALDDFIGSGKVGRNEYASAGRSANPAVRVAMADVMRAIKEGNSTKTIEYDPKIASGISAWRQIDSILERNGNNPQAAMEAILKDYPSTRGTLLDRISNYIMKKTDTTSLEVPVKQSKFMTAATDQGEYWARDTELFARVFSDYLRVKSGQMGIKNNYMARTYDGGLLFSPENMADIAPAMDNLLTTLKKEYNLGDAPVTAAQAAPVTPPNTVAPTTKLVPPKAPVAQELQPPLSATNDLGNSPSTGSVAPKSLDESGKAIVSEDGSVIPTIRKAVGKSKAVSDFEAAFEATKNLPKQKDTRLGDTPEASTASYNKQLNAFAKEAKQLNTPQAKQNATQSVQASTVAKQSTPRVSQNLADSSAKNSTKPPIVGTAIRQPKTSRVVIDRPASLPESIKNSPGTDAELAKIIQNNGYTVKPNEETLAKAYAQLNSNPMELVDEVFGMKIGKKNSVSASSVTGKALPDADQVAKSMVAIDYLARNGLFRQADEIVQKLTKQSTQLGQAVQILAAYGRTTPAGIYRYAQKLAHDAKIELPPDTLDKLVKQAIDIENMPKGHNKDIARAVLLKDAIDILPSTRGDKAAMALYLAQLLNVKTFARNVIGNSFNLAAQNTSDLLAAGLDAARVGVTKAAGGKAVRQVYAPNLIQQAKDFSQGLKLGAEDAKLGIDTRGLLAGATTQSGGTRNAFKSKIGKGLEKALAYELSAFDRAFYETSANQLKRNLMKGQGLKNSTPEIDALADDFGKYMTFQDDTALARVAIGLKKTVLNSGKSFGAGSFVINYPKTPANLINRSVAYSPLGFAKASMELYRVTQGKGSALAVEQALSRAAVGTVGLVGVGAHLHSLGIMEAKENESKTDLSAFNKAFGGGRYTINTSALKRYILSGFDEKAAEKEDGDTNVSYDWAQPLSSSLTMGAAINEYNGKDTAFAQRMAGVGGAVAKGTTAGLQSIVEQPLLTGVQDFFNAQDPVAGIMRTAQGVPGSFVPSLARQTRQLLDNTQRQTYDKNPLKESFNKTINSVPGLSTKLPAQINQTTGKPAENYQNGTNNPFNVYINPAFISKTSGDGVVKELRRLHEKDGDAGVIPNTVKKHYKINGETRVLTANEMTRMQEYVGLTNAYYLDKIINSESYKSADDATKTRTISNMLSDVTAEAKRQILGSDSKAGRSQRAIASGGDYSVSAKGGAGITVNPKTSTYTQKVLNQYNSLDSETIKKKSYSENDYDYKVAQAKFDNKVANGEYSTAQRINAEQAVRKAKAGKDYSKDIREIYGLSNDEIVDYLENDPDGNNKAKQLAAYDQALVDAGARDKVKFKNNTIARSSKGRSGGRGGRKASNTAFATAISKNNALAMSNDKALRNLVKGAKLRSGGTRKLNASKVAIKKQNVKQRKSRVA